MEYQLEGQVLRISGDLSDPLDTEFDTYSTRLLSQDATPIILDLTDVRYMGSWYLGRIADLAMKANMENKSLKVVAAGKIAQIIQLAGLDKLVDLEARE